MSAATTTIQTTLLRSTIGKHRSNVMNNNVVPVHINRKPFAFGRSRCFVVVASKSPNSNSNSNSNSNPNPNSNSNDADTSQDNLKFLLKLGAGSFAGAAVIKYGSILVPEITQPNITLALIMIITPVIVSVLILIKESTVEQ